MTLLIQNATLILPDRVVPRGYVLIEGDRIARAGEGEAPSSIIHHPSSIVIDATHMVALPGLVNAHTHLEQTFMRGYSANRALLDWLKHYIWKLQGAMTPEDVRLAVTLGLVEAMRGGATTIIDHHKVPFSRRHTDVVLETADKLGVRLVLARAWADRGANAELPGAILDDLKRLFDEWHGAANGRIHIANGPLVPWRCSPETLRRTTELARRHGAITHCHMNETQAEVAMTLGETGMRPVEWFASLGILGPDFHAVHGVWLSDREIALLAQHGATVTHCPAANMILASGVAPIWKLVTTKGTPEGQGEHGINVALGTDGPASNDGQDMFEMMRLAAYLQRVTTLDERAMPPRRVIAMATVAGARAVGSPSLRVGDKADLVLLDFDAAHIQPVGDVLASIVYNVRGSDVDTLIVDGRPLIQDKRVLCLDEQVLIAECRDRARHLAHRAGIE
ncbi:MAG: N-ethylammeline chlorohydrolase [Candidatus Roseilinea sp.]|jgi:5-methylthioadenosine/S-adenosylhomocysteine deaminase|nr:MAG: N-ethylammeline chlorohydrolase [Candidatus Roseilinea sp.]